MPRNAGTQPDQEERQATDLRHEISNQTSNLTGRYGRIGIPAVAAALRYTTAAKNPAYAPVVERVDARLIEMAA